MLDHEIVNLTNEIVNNFKKEGLVPTDKALETFTATVKQGIENFFKNQIAVIWTVEDVMQTANGIGVVCDGDIANNVLDNILHDHDANVGINWQVIEESLCDVTKES